MYDHYFNAINILMRELEMSDFAKIIRIAIQEYIKSVTPFLEDYEKKEYPLKSATPEEVLRFLMEENDLSQYDLASDFGGQPVVSDILRGKRKLTREHIERLSKRFGISPATFFAAQS
jgi:HTH-type transcriptional regulator/antitoxin HigA